MRIWKGKLHLECTGAQIVSFIDQAVQEKIYIEDIFWVDEQKVHIVVGLSDFFRLLKCGRRNQIRTRITKKSGAPFLWKRIKKKKAFFIGFVSFFLILFCMTSVVWRVEIEGSSKEVSVDHIRKVLETKGVYFGQLKARLPKSNIIQHEVLAKFPNLSWVGFRVEGTRVVLTIVEKKRTEIHKSEFPSHGPVHLISRKNALIVDIRAEQGNPLVEVNDMVKAGQILISGVYGNPEQGSGPIVGARGKVMGEVWYESSVAVPIIQKTKVFTGAKKKSKYACAGDAILRNPFSTEPFKQYETVRRNHSIYIGSFKLPFGWIEEEYLESEFVTQKLSMEDAVKLGENLSRRSLRGSISRDGTIREEKVLQRFIKHDKVYLKVHFDVIENIAVPQPILRGE